MTTNLFPILSKRILPAVAAICLATASNSQAATSDGQTLINAKLSELAAQGVVKAGTTLTSAKDNELLLAIALALENPGTSTATPADIAEGALAAFGGKTRGDKDKIAGQVIATVVATKNLGNDATAVGEITRRVYNVNAGTLKAGKIAAITGAVKSAGSAAVANQVGTEIATLFTPVKPTDTSKLLADVSKALGTSTAAASTAFAGFTKNFLSVEIPNPTDRETAARTAAEATAAKNSAAAGAIIGGYTQTLTLSDATIQAEGIKHRNNTKLAKALGAIIANISSTHTNKNGLLSALFTGIAKPTAEIKAQLAQGVLRAANATEANTLMDNLLDEAEITDRSKIAATVASGNGDNAAKIGAITTKLANGQTLTALPNIGIAVIGAIGTQYPEGANPAIRALVAGQADKLGIGTAVASKLKTYAAVGHLAAGIAEENVGTPQSVALAMMAKAGNASQDIVHRVAALSTVTDRVAFAGALADANKAKVQAIAVGASLAAPTSAAAITAEVVTHDIVGDKGTLGKVATIGGAVALAVDEEHSADIAAALGAKMSDKGLVAGKPIQLSNATKLASAIAKAIQAKPGVSTENRKDEIGEVSATIVAAILSTAGNTPDLKKQAAINKLITGVGTAIAKELKASIQKTLNKKAPEAPQNYAADVRELSDVAGSIAMTVKASTTLDAAHKAALLNDTTGLLEAAFLKAAGKNTVIQNQVRAAFDYVSTTDPANNTKYETGSVNDKETDTKNG